MPSTEIPIHTNRLPRTTRVAGVSVRSDVMFTNAKGQEKSGIQKRNEKALAKLSPALQRMLLADEVVLLMTRARSPLSIFEQLTSGWWTYMLAAVVLVVTNRRILFIPVKPNGTWRKSVRAASWGDVAEVKSSGPLVRNVAFKFKNGTTATFANFRHGDAKKLAAVAAVIVPRASGEITAVQGLVQYCPDCHGILTPRQYCCPGCGLVFKNEKTMITRSIFLPGGGYFYTGHPLVALLPAIFEGLLLLQILLVLFEGLTAPKAIPELTSALIALVFFWAIETGVTIIHCRRYIREFIPEKRDPLRAQNAAVANNA